MKKRKFSAKFKTKVVLEALKEISTLSELAQKYELAPTQIRTWKKQFLEGAEDIFERPSSKKTEEERDERSELGELVPLAQR